MASSTHCLRDPHTLSNYNEFTTTHTLVNFKIEFEEKIIGGSVTLSLKSLTDAATKEIFLDTSHLIVRDVNIHGKASKWEVLSRLEPYGSALKIPLEQGIKHGEVADIEIQTKTTDKCTALGWMTPVQTSSEHPYVYSHCQAIHARSIFPCQDTPEVKSTFDFNIESTLPTLASGLATGTRDVGREGSAENAKLYSFKQEIPIPSYLFAVASGDIVQAEIVLEALWSRGQKSFKPPNGNSRNLRRSSCRYSRR